MTYVVLIVLYVLIHYMFVSQTSQVLALLGVFLDVGIRGGVPAPLMAFALLFASSYFSVITPAGWQPERHLRRQRLSQQPNSTAGSARDAVLPGGVSRDRNALDLVGHLTDSSRDFSLICPPDQSEKPARRNDPFAHRALATSLREGTL